jgi:adenylyltransferase/sulfurtransferase
LKEILGIGDSLSGWLLVCNALDATFRKIRLPRDPDCPLCGDPAAKSPRAAADEGGHGG